MKRVTIIDYGVGNIFGLRRALMAVGAEVVVSEEANDIRNAEAVVLPGVGSFEAGMRGLSSRGLVEVVSHVCARDVPVLGICLGAQLLLGTGYEYGLHAGLNIIPGKVVSLQLTDQAEKIPHVGWNQVREPVSSVWKDTLFHNLPPDFAVYFTHSFVLVPDAQTHILSTSLYGGTEFVSAVRTRRVTGVQFHPEKSGEVGLTILKNFINLA